MSIIRFAKPSHLITVHEAATTVQSLKENAGLVYGNRPPRGSKDPKSTKMKTAPEMVRNVNVKEASGSSFKS